MVLSDLFLSEHMESIVDLDFNSTIERGEIVTSNDSDKLYKRFKYTDNGVSPRAFPGTSNTVFQASSDEHDDYGNTHTQRRIAMYEEAISILEGTRLAGSYKQYVLRDFKGLLRSRSLLARDRALLGPQTPEVVARLFGGSVDPAASRRATRRRRPLPQRAWATFPLPKRLVGVPDPVFWKVMEYWRLGDWRRPA